MHGCQHALMTLDIMQGRVDRVREVLAEGKALLDESEL